MREIDDPKISWVESYISVHDRWADAGFERIDEKELVERYVFYHRWLAENGLISVDPKVIDRDFVLYKSQVTEDGWKFLPKVHDKFSSLAKPGRSKKQDLRYLNMRYRKLVRPDA